MNSHINKEIFSESGCINMDMLLRYRDGKLGNTEKHEVEKHLVDCNLCTEAVEGFSFVGSTVAVDALKDKIGELTSGNTNPFSVRYLAVAASIAAVLILSYFTYQQVTDVKQERFAVTEMQTTGETSVPVTYQDSVSPDLNAATTQEQEPVTEKPVLNEFPFEVNERVLAKPVMKAEDEVAEVQTMDTEEVVALKENVPASAMEISNDVVTDEVTAVSVTGNSAPAGYMSNVTYVDNRKVIDYSAKKATKEKTTALSENHTPSKYQNKQKKAEAQKDAMVTGEEVPRKVSYLQLLSEPIEMYNSGKYEMAIKEFDEILKLNPGDENARFYKGMSLYHLKNYDQAIGILVPLSKLNTNPFSEEALFYVAKSHAAKGDSEKATLIFRSIVTKGGFYKERAIEELK